MTAGRIFKLTPVFLIAAILLCGCTETKIECGVDRDNSAWLSYTVHVDRGDLSQTDWINTTGLLKTVKNYWQSEGFETKTDSLDDQIELTAVKKEKASNREKTFDALLGMMESDASPFTLVSGDYSGGYFADEYYLSAECDFSGIIPAGNRESLPYNINDDIDEILNNSTIEVVISLPGEVVETNGEKTEGGCNFTAGFAQASSVSIKTRIDNEENIAEYSGMVDGMQMSKTIAIFAGVLAAVFAIAMIVVSLLLLRAARQNRLAGRLKNTGIEPPVEALSQIDEDENNR